MKTLFILTLMFFSFWVNAQWGEKTLDEIQNLRKAEAKPMVILFSTDWCGICRMQKKNLKKLPAEFWDKIYFVGINPEKYYQDIEFLGKKYSYISNGATGLHSLAYDLAGKKTPAYPFWVFVDAENRVSTYEGILRIEELQDVFQ